MIASLSLFRAFYYRVDSFHVARNVHGHTQSILLSLDHVYHNLSLRYYLTVSCVCGAIAGEVMRASRAYG